MREQFLPIRNTSIVALGLSLLQCLEALNYSLANYRADTWTMSYLSLWVTINIIVAAAITGCNLYVHWKTFLLFEYERSKPSGMHKLMRVSLISFALYGSLVLAHLLGLGLIYSPFTSLNQILIWHYSVQILPWIALLFSIVSTFTSHTIVKELRITTS